MVRLIRWLVRLTTLLIVLVLAVGLLAYYFASRSLPEYDSEREVAGLSRPIEIVRDNANVPHIFGEADEDVYFGLGYAHAQDRLWQMTMLRRTAQGRLSELFGPRTLEIDKLLRTLGLYDAAVRSVAVQDEYATEALNAYAAGVNAWLAEVNSGARGRGAPEMWLFNHPISPWQPADSVAILKIMALQLTGHASSEVLRARLSLLLPEERLLDILPEDPTDGIAALPSQASLSPELAPLPRYAALVPGIAPSAAAIPTPFGGDPLAPVKPRGFAGASNAWAAMPDRSATGGTLLANDPHLGLTAPTIWYLARLELNSGGVIGGTIPGLPLVLSGRNADLGWGLTTAYLDDQDIRIEEVNPENPQEYRTPDGWAPFATRDSIIRIKDGAAETLKLRFTENGPVLAPDQYDVGSVTPAGHVAALSWTALSPEDTSVSAGMEMMRAETVNGAIDALENLIAPAQNVTLADTSGNIALVVAGAMPARDANHQSRGRLPSYGYLPENRWDGRLPFSDNPLFRNPRGGIVGNTNNKTTDQDFPAHVSFEWGDTQRIFRWERLMQARQVHTRDSFIEAQLDTVSFTARSLLALMGADLWFTGDPAPEGTPERRRQIALDLLSAWNGEMNEHLPEPLIYATWLREFNKRLIRDELGPLASEFAIADPVFVERVLRDIDGASAWCDILQSAPVETCEVILRQSLDEALIWITETYGLAIEAVRWGDAHLAMHDHPVLGDVPVLDWIVNIRQSTSGGDNTLQRGRTSGTGEHPFRNVHASGYRGVYDFADPDSSVFITATGQSGHPLSRFYDNLGERWRQGEYIPMSLDPELARAAAVGVTVLRPYSDEVNDAAE